jgi:predicted metalloprotease with PDZ domain
VVTDISDAAVVYDVRLRDPGAHIFEVTCRIHDPDPDGQTVSMPAWTPGSYMIRDFARHVIAVEAEANGEPVPLRKVDKSTWRISPVDGPLLLRAEVYAHDLSVRGAYLDLNHAFINGAAVFLRVDDKQHERCVVHVSPPDHCAENSWKVATGMERLTGTADDFGAFVALGYNELIDHPILVGELSFGKFDVAGTEHVIAIFGDRDTDCRRLERDLQKLCTYHVDFFGAPVPMNRYTFLITAVSAGYGGLEHRNSSALLCARSDLPRTGMTQVDAGYQTFLGLVSHEYFHLWNIKRIRPAEFVPYKLDQEVYTRQLWVFEGITSYFDDLALLRSGLISQKSYLEVLGRSLTSVYQSGGRRRQTLEESSFDAWIKFYKQNENSPNTMVSYYRKGAMVALALDLELRLKSAGQCSLDDVMRALWRKFGEDSSRGLPDGGFERLAEEVSGLNLGDFFRQALRTTVDPPVGILLAQFGIRLNMRARESEADVGGTAGKHRDQPRAWLGFRTGKRGDRSFVKTVISDGPAVKRGLSANDELVALDGYRVTADNFSQLIERIDVGQAIDIDVFRRDELLRVTVVAAASPRDMCYLIADDDADEPAAQRRQQWLEF